MFRSSPRTTAMGTSGVYRSTTVQSSVASKRGSWAARAYARRITGAWKHCGVWPRRSRCRGSTSSRVVPVVRSTRTTVSAEGMAVSTAPKSSSAATQSAMIRWLTRGRTATWKKAVVKLAPGESIELFEGV